MRANAKLCLTQNTHKNIVDGHMSSFLYFIDMERCDLGISKGLKPS